MKRRQRLKSWAFIKRGHSFALGIIALISVYFALSGFIYQASALTTVPTKMNFQGRLADASGNIKANGTYNMKLRIYDASSGGTLKYSEDRLVSAGTGIAVSSGLFSLKIGEGSNISGIFDASIFATGTLYLEVELPTPATATSSTPTWTEGAMSPRNQMATSAYAYNAETLDGIDSASFAQLGTIQTWTADQNFGYITTAGGAGFAGDVSVGGTSATIFNVQNAVGATAFHVDTTNNQVRIGADSTIDVGFALDVKTTAGDLTGTNANNGVMYYNNNAGKFRCYEAGAWTDCISGATMQSGYTASTGGTTPEIKLDATRGGFDIQDANTTTGGNLFTVRASNGSGLGSALLNVTSTGMITLKNSVDSTNAFAIQNSSSDTLFGIGTSDRTVSIGVAAVNDTFTKLTNPATLPNQARGTAFSPDSQYMSVSQATSPFITIYKRSGDTFTKLADPATLPTGTGIDTAFSPDGQYLSVGSSTSPFITIYKRSGDTFTKLSNPVTLPPSSVSGVAFSPDSQYMSVASSTSPFITIYKRSGDTFTKLADPATLPTGTGNDTAFSPDGQYMSVAHSTSPFITIYKRSGDTFTKLSNPVTLPTNTGDRTAFSPDGQYMTVSNSVSPYIAIYKTSAQKVTSSIQGSVTLSDNFSAQNISASSGITTNNLLTNGLQVNGDTVLRAFVDTSATFGVLSTAGTSLFNVDSLNSSVLIGTSDTIGAVLVLDTKTTSGDPTGANATNGAMYYNSNSGKFRCYQNGSWVDCIAAAGTPTNQLGYSNSTGGTTPEFKLDATRGAVDIQDADTTTGSSLLNVRASNGSGLGTSLFSVGNTGDTLHKTTADSATAFDIQDTAGKGLLGIDTLADQVQIGDATADGVGVVLILDSKNTAGDPTGVAGGMYYNSSLARFRCYENGRWNNCIGSIMNTQTTATQTMTAGSDLYLTGSAITLPTYGLTAPSSGRTDGTLLTWRIYLSKTAAGTLASTLTMRVGTAGTTADTSKCTALNTGTGTAAVDGAIITVTAYATNGGSSATLNCSMTLSHSGAVGFSTAGMVQQYSTATSFDSTVSGTKFGLSFQAGTASVITVQKVEVTATNL